MCGAAPTLQEEQGAEGRVEDVAKNLAVFAAKARAPGKTSEELS